MDGKSEGSSTLTIQQHRAPGSSTSAQPGAGLASPSGWEREAAALLAVTARRTASRGRRMTISACGFLFNARMLS